MLSPDIIRLLLIISFFLLGFNVSYIIIIKRKHNQNKAENDIDGKLKETRLIARIGVIVLSIFIVVCSINIFIYQYLIQIIPRINLSFLDEMFQIIGFTFIIGGNITLFFAYKELGIYWSYPIDGISTKRKLITSGVYSKIRHPIYLSFNLFSIGFVLVQLDWILLAMYIIGGIGLYYQAIDEETILNEYFGQEYEDYMKKTGRFFVKFNKKECEEQEA